jgi:phosphate starvation-inducible PhoH-like protein
MGLIKQSIAFFITSNLYLYNSISMHRLYSQYSRISSTLFANRISSSVSTSTSSNNANPKYQPKTPSQIEYVNALLNPKTKLIIAVGPAGTGKSLFACSNAIQSLKKKQIEKIILTRPLVSVADEDIGFLPGNLNSKMSIWVQPMMDIFMEHMNKKDISNLIQSSVIEVTPLLYMRGRTFKNTIIIADEIQNTTPQQLLMLLTRCGDNSKIIVTGDVNQSDLKDKNGLVDFIERFETANIVSPDLIKLIQFNSSDIQRSELVKQVLNIYFQPTTQNTNTDATYTNTTQNTNTTSLVLLNERVAGASSVDDDRIFRNGMEENAETTDTTYTIKKQTPTINNDMNISNTNTQTSITNAIQTPIHKRDYSYMKETNDHASKIPSEYGDYIYCIQPDNTTDIIENDCALIPKHLMR